MNSNLRRGLAGGEPTASAYRVRPRPMRAKPGLDLDQARHLAALAIEHGAELYSRDNDFARFAGVRWVDPLA